MIPKKETCKDFENNKAEILLEVMAFERFIFKNIKARKKWQVMVMTESNDEITCCVIAFAVRWAKIMQFIMSQNESVTVADIADKTSYIADFQESFEGLNGGIIYDNAVIMLCEYWKYGNELRKWHNSQLGYEGEGIASPTVTTNHLD